MKKIIMALVCLMTMIVANSCSSDDDASQNIKDEILGDWLLASVSNNDTCFDFNYKGVEFTKTGYVNNIYGEKEWLTWVCYSNSEYLMLSFCDWGGDIMVSCNGFDTIYNAWCGNIGINNGYITFDKYNFDYAFKKFYEGVICARVELELYRKGFHYSPHNTYEDSLVYQFTKEYKPFLDTCIPIESKGHFIHNGNTINIVLNCSGGERNFCFVRFH